MTPNQVEVDAMNAEFWNELCGSHMAKHYGITDHSPESLRRFDDLFFSFYPYFLPIIRPERMAGKDVLEIGLGYGSLSQRLAEAGARYIGLDIAPNPVRMVNLRLQMQGLEGQAHVGTALDMPFHDESFDFVCSIGCFHHTGDVQRCFDETWRVLRPGGTALVMVYNKYSFRQWSQWPIKTFKELVQDWAGRPRKERLEEARRFPYDHNDAGQAAPETVLLGQRELRGMLSQFKHVRMQKQNADHLSRAGRILVSREKLLTNLGRWLGLDIYIEAKKAGVRSHEAVAVGSVRGESVRAEEFASNQDTRPTKPR